MIWGVPSNMPAGSVASSTSSIPDEEEPRLKYQRLEADTGDLLLETEAACLCVSEKMLALGTRDGTVHLLDYDGNEVPSSPSLNNQSNLIMCLLTIPVSCASLLLVMVLASGHGQTTACCPQVRCFQAHKGPVNDLCFDETAEFVGSCSDDGGAMVSFLYEILVAKFSCQKPCIKAFFTI